MKEDLGRNGKNHGSSTNNNKTTKEEQEIRAAMVTKVDIYFFWTFQILQRNIRNKFNASLKIKNK